MSVLVIAAIYVACAFVVVLLADQVAARTFKVSKPATPALASISADHQDREISL